MIGRRGVDLERAETRPSERGGFWAQLSAWRRGRTASSAAAERDAFDIVSTDDADLYAPIDLSAQGPSSRPARQDGDAVVVAGRPNTGPAAGADQRDGAVAVAEPHGDATNSERQRLNAGAEDLQPAPLPYRITVVEGLQKGAEIEADDGLLRLAGLAAVAGRDPSANPGADPEAVPDLVIAELDGDMRTLELAGGWVFGPTPDAPPSPTPCRIDLDGAVLEITGLAPPLPIRMGGDDAPGAGSRAPEDMAAAQWADPPSPPPGAPARKSGASLGAAVAGVALSLLVVGATVPFSGGSDPAGPGHAAAPPTQAAMADVSSRLAALSPLLTAEPTAGGVRVSGVTGLSGDAVLGDSLASIRAAHPGLEIDVSAVQGPADASEALAERLAAGGLAEAVALRADANGIRAQGTVPPTQAQFWADIADWYDSRYGAAIPLLRDVAVASAPSAAPRLGLQAVWVGRNPYLIAADGQRRRPGDRVAGAWRIAKISPQRVRLSRGSEIHDILLSDSPTERP